MTDQAVSTFRQTLRGRLVRPTDADYDPPPPEPGDSKELEVVNDG